MYLFSKKSACNYNHNCATQYMQLWAQAGSYSLHVYNLVIKLVAITSDPLLEHVEDWSGS